MTVQGDAFNPGGSRVVPAPVSPSAAGPTDRVLVVDAEPGIVEVVVIGLRHAGHVVRGTTSGPAAVVAAASFAPEVVVFDPALPDVDGFAVLDRLRGPHRGVPVLLLTTSDAAPYPSPEDTSIGDRVSGNPVTAGCPGPDAVLVKPFGMGELAARVGLLLADARAAVVPAVSTWRLRAADVVLDEGTGRVWRNGYRVELSSTEVALLRCLLIRAGQVVPVGDLLTRVGWGRLPGAGGLLEAYLTGLRRQLDLAGPSLIHRVPGGYRFSDR